MRLFRAWSGNVCRFDGELVHLVATRGGPGEAGPSIRGRFPTRPTAGLTVGRCILDRAVIQIDDVETEMGLVEATPGDGPGPWLALGPGRPHAARR